MKLCKVQEECKALQKKINGRFVCHKVCTHTKAETG